MTAISILHLNDVLSKKSLTNLRNEKDFKVIDNLKSISQIKDINSHQKIDIVLAKAEDQQDLQAMANLLRKKKDLKVIIIGDVNEATAFKYAKLGAKGYLKNNVSLEILKKAIKTVCHKSEVWFDRKISSQVFEKFAMQSTTRETPELLKYLSKREKEILYLLVEGYKNKEISHSLFISEQTVKTHIYHIFEKLGVKDRVNAVLYVKKAEKSGQK